MPRRTSPEHKQFELVAYSNGRTVACPYAVHRPPARVAVGPRSEMIEAIESSPFFRSCELEVIACPPAEAAKRGPVRPNSASLSAAYSLLAVLWKTVMETSPIARPDHSRLRSLRKAFLQAERCLDHSPLQAPSAPWGDHSRGPM
jgi:hypothetical protein